jgi:signal transduction histidine kinase
MQLRARIQSLTILSLVALTIWVVVISAAPALPVIGGRLVELGTFGLLTAFALALSLHVGVGKMSLAHSVGMMAFLSLDAATQPAMTIAIFLGGLLGGVLLAYLMPRYANPQPTTTHTSNENPLCTIGFAVSQTTLAFFVASNAYMLLGGSLPLRASSRGILTDPAVLVFVLFYCVLYFVLFVLHVYTSPQVTATPSREDTLSIGIIVLLPVPFSLAAAQVGSTENSLGFFMIMVVGLVLIIFGLYVLNRFVQQFKQRLDDMSRIAQATQSFGQTLDYAALVQTIYQQARDLLKLEHFTLALQAPDSDTLTYPLLVRDGERQAAPATPPDDDGLLKHVLTTGAALVLPDQVAKRATSLGLQPPAAQVRSWMGVPIQVGQRTVGAFVARTHNDSQRFSRGDEHLMAILGTSAGIAIENAYLYHQQAERAEQLATLSQVSALLTVTLSPVEVIDTVVTSASVISNADATAVYIYWDDEYADDGAATQGAAPQQPSDLTLVRSSGLSDTFIRTAPLPLITREANTNQALTPAPIIIEDTRSSPQAAPLRDVMLTEGILGWVELALSIGGKQIGVLVLYFRQPLHMIHEQIDLFNAFSTQASQAINNARAYSAADEALEQRMNQLYTLATAGRLLNATLETRQVYDIVLTYALDATHAHAGFIALRDESTQAKVVSSANFPVGFFDAGVHLRNVGVRDVLRDGQHLRVPDVRTDPREVALLPGTHSVLMTPLTRGSDVLGCIVLESSESHAFGQSDEHFVSQIANQAIIAADNTQLFQRIREARDNLKVILDTMSEGIILIDTDHMIALANPRVDMIGLHTQGLIGQRLDTIVAQPDLELLPRMGFDTPDQLQALLDDLDGPQSWTQPVNHSYDVRLEHNTHFIERQIIAVRDDRQTVIGLLLVFYNRTEEYELERAREALSQMVVHDLRSPLTAVTTSLRLLREVVPKEAEYRKIVERTTDASKRAIRKVLLRVDALLDIARMESGDMQLETEPADLTALVENIRHELMPMARELAVTISSEVEADLPLIDVDIDKVERLLMNLVDNALKYSPEDSTVHIKTRREPQSNFVHIAVIDEGPGVPDEYKQRLFDRFVQVKGRETVRRGVGLGLTFCKLVTEAHGGAIWIEDNPSGVGSVFNCTLPILTITEPTT